MADVADRALFKKMLVERHCLHLLLPTKRAYDRLRPRGHSFELASCTLELHKRSFIPRCLYKYYLIRFLFRVFCFFFSFFLHIGTAFMFVFTSICPYYYILTYLFRVTVNHLLCYFMLCAFVTYSIKLLFSVAFWHYNRSWLLTVWDQCKRYEYWRPTNDQWPTTDRPQGL